jgi:hypothetical protein
VKFPEKCPSTMATRGHSIERVKSAAMSKPWVLRYHLRTAIDGFKQARIQGASDAPPYLQKIFEIAREIGKII